MAKASYRFEEVTPEAVEAFFADHLQGSFAQSVPMAAVRRDSGRDVRFLAIYKGEVIVAACQLSLIRGRFPSADCTAGPLIDYQDEELLQFFTGEIRRYCKKRGCVYLTITPNIPYSDESVNILKRLGWQYSGRINASAVGIRGGIRWMYVKDLAGQTIENYRDAYAKRHRRYIRNADPRLRVRTLQRDELELFFTIMQHTAERRQFASRKIDYFYSLYDNFGEKATFLIAELTDEAASTPIAGIVFIESNNQIVSYLGGALAEYANYRGTYVLHDEMIRRAIEKGYAEYNFYGIEGDIDNPQSEGYGVYVFKTKFGGGRPVELLGEFILPIDTIKYMLFRLLKR